MRARLALWASGQAVELREVVLRSKPAELVAASAKATVPVLVQPDGSVLEQSLDIMRWALQRSDPAGWLAPTQGSLDGMLALIALIDGDFKQHLDRYKYPGRYEDDSSPRSTDMHRSAAGLTMAQLNQQLADQPYLFGLHAALADMAIAPFVRQFAHVDPDWFAAQPWSRLQAWLADWEASELLAQVMQKYPAWDSGTAGVTFGPQS
ncbi:glutathione S-transferase [Rhodoferax sp.]|uniref:glutathione S-transferase n=1 Tax=Rhodoferax sp. TaxID=50421 RepID=UPI00374CCF65